MVVKTLRFFGGTVEVFESTRSEIAEIPDAISNGFNKSCVITLDLADSSEMVEPTPEKIQAKIAQLTTILPK